MKIAVVGSGAVGGYFGGRLAQAGQDVTFIARGKHLDAMVSDGLSVQSICGDFVVHPAKAASRPEEVSGPEREFQPNTFETRFIARLRRREL